MISNSTARMMMMVNVYDNVIITIMSTDYMENRYAYILQLTGCVNRVNKLMFYDDEKTRISFQRKFSFLCVANGIHKLYHSKPTFKTPTFIVFLSIDFK